MTNRPADKGRIAENAVVSYLAEHGFPYAERRRLQGINDKGDIISSPGLVWEVKYAGSSKLRLTGWMKETRDEVANAEADFGILVIKQPKVGEKSAGRFLAVMDKEAFGRLVLHAAEGGLDWVRMPVFGHSNAATSTLCQAVDQIHPDFQYWRIEFPARNGQHGHQGLVVMNLRQMVELVRFAGYGDPVRCNDGVHSVPHRDCILR